MAPIEWKENYSVGVEAVDHEHRELIDLVNRIEEALTSNAPPDQARAVFGDLFRAISSHFALEERFMREHRYDQTSDHKADHERLLDELRDLMDDYEADPAIGAAAAAQLVARVGDWFTNHFKTHDARLHTRLGDHPH